MHSAYLRTAAMVLLLHSKLHRWHSTHASFSKQSICS